jgi:hypothetical protein
MTATAEQVSLSREEYERLLAAAPAQTVTITVAEFNELVAAKTDTKALDALKQERDRFAARCRELESCLRREQQEHSEEIDRAVKRIKQLGG